MDMLAEAVLGNISVLCAGKDYHDLLKSRLKQLARPTWGRQRGLKVFRR